jgi:hypothetical protein
MTGHYNPNESRPLLNLSSSPTGVRGGTAVGDVPTNFRRRSNGRSFRQNLRAGRRQVDVIRIGGRCATPPQKRTYVRRLRFSQLDLGESSTSSSRISIA